MKTPLIKALSVLSLTLLLVPFSACGTSEPVVGEWTLDSQGRYTRLIFSEDGAVDVYSKDGLVGTGQWSHEGFSDVVRIELKGETWSGIKSSGSLAFQSKGREPTIYRKSEF